jgi:tRNA(fMet)-specific endonuclease VapC
VVNVDHETADTYAELFADLRRAGTPVPTNDLWVAAMAVREGATVLTYDDHFRRIVRVGCLVLKTTPVAV